MLGRGSRAESSLVDPQASLEREVAALFCGFAPAQSKSVGISQVVPVPRPRRGDGSGVLTAPGPRQLGTTVSDPSLPLELSWSCTYLSIEEIQCWPKIIG